MKATNFLTASALIGCTLLSGLSAAEEKKSPTVTYIVDIAKNTTTAAGTFVSVDDPQAAELAQFGSKLIERIGGQLVSEINRELATRDIADSIDVMHLKSLALPKPRPGEPTVTAIKRTSSMLRDLANSPDAADQAALDKIHAQLMANETPDKIIVQKIEHTGQPVEWRVYRPIATTQSCLACHGDPANFSPAVKEILAKKYPGDKAVDYRRQEYRGILRVSLLAPEKK
jgi:hypothetical protein